MRLSAAVFCLFMALTVAPAGARADNLALPDVLKGLSWHPLVAAQEARVAKEQAEILISQGAFDTTLNIESYNRAMGFYDGKYSRVAVVNPLRDIGGQIEGGYRIGNEDFPVYEDELRTLGGGEVFTSVTVPILRNLFTDAQRTRLMETRLAREIAEHNLTALRLDLFSSAASAYWSWVQKGNELKTIESIMDIAEVRLQQLKKRSDAGDIPALDVTDAERILMKRKADVAKAEQEFLIAANKLSMFMRDADKQAVMPPKSGLPAISQANCTDVANLTQLVTNAKDNRPELKALDLQLKQVDLLLELAKNELLPRLDFKLTGQEDVGSGEDALDRPELKVGALFSVPFERRVAKGRIEKAETSLAELKSQRKFLEDKIAIEIGVAHASFLQACRQIDLTEKEEAASREVAEGERKKFGQGDSSLVVVNLREQDVAEAAVRVIKAKAEQQVALVDLIAGQGLELYQK